jgi:hypothetical protein
MQLQTGYLKHYWISFFWLLNFILPH